MSWTPAPISCGVQEQQLDSTMENRGGNHQSAGKQNKKWKIIEMSTGKKRDSHAPITDVLQEPGEDASETSRVTPDPSSVARGRPRMGLDQPSWQPPDEGELPEHSSGEPPTREARAEAGISSAVRIHGNVLELAGRVQKYPTRVLLDSGSTGNFISTQFVAAVGLKVQPDPEWEEITLADGSRLKTEGRVQFMLRCGGYKGRILARVFPNLHKEIILGIPWLRQANPAIDWAQRRVTVQHRGCDVVLPLIHKRGDAETTAAEVNLCTAKHVAKQVKRGHAVFVAVVRLAQEG